MLEKVPPGKFGWQPHDKSMTIGILAPHVAEIPVWVNRILESVVFDFATASMVRNTYGDTAALLKNMECEDVKMNNIYGGSGVNPLISNYG